MLAPLSAISLGGVRAARRGGRLWNFQHDASEAY